jgi:hypothetical protein
MAVVGRRRRDRHGFALKPNAPAQGGAVGRDEYPERLGGSMLSKKKRWLAGGFVAACVVAAAISPRVLGRATAAQGGKYPVFEPDTTFPKLPNDWVIGNVSKVVVDKGDHVWFIHRPRTVPKDKKAAPPVLEFDANGTFVQGWGGPAAGYDWPDAEHNIFVDHKDNVWISGTSPSGQSQTQNSDDMILKFTRTGKFIMEIGGRSKSNGSLDTNSVNKPGDIYVSPKTNELYVADGYGNRRLIVFDADTGKFKRMWGAFAMSRPMLRPTRPIRMPTRMERHSSCSRCTPLACRTTGSSTCRIAAASACRSSRSTGNT